MSCGLKSFAHEEVILGRVTGSAGVLGQPRRSISLPTCFTLPKNGKNPNGSPEGEGFGPIVETTSLVDRLDSKTMHFLKMSVALTILCCVLSSKTIATSGARPNILFIYTDDQSHRSVSCYPEAHDWIGTPNIDELAKQGVRFHRAYIGTWCMASRASMLTGLHPFAIESMRMDGKYPGSEYNPDKCRFWPRYLRAAGYTTAQIGKWHTGRDTGYGRDWDFQAVWNRPGHPEDSANYYGPQLISFNGASSVPVEGYSTDNYTDWAVDFITNQTDEHFLPHGRHADKPWYLWLCYSAVHGPSTPADRHLHDYQDSVTPIPEDIFGPRPNKPPYLRERTKWKRDADGNPQGLDAEVRKYNRCVRALDEGVGQLMRALHDSGQLENTLVVFTSDQGFAWGQHGLKEKWAPYDAALRAPLIISFPSRIPTDRVCTTPVGGIDLIPTFLRYAGVEHPWMLSGHDLTSLLEDPASDWPHPVMICQTDRIYGSATAPLPVGKDVYHAGLPWYVLLTKGRYKYIRYLADGEGEEFYDLEDDPDELHNLIAAGRCTELIDQYRSGLMSELRRTRAPFVDTMPPVR